MAPERVQHLFLLTVDEGWGIFPALWCSGLFSRTAECFLTGKKGNGFWQAEGTCWLGEDCDGSPLCVLSGCREEFRFPAPSYHVE